MTKEQIEELRGLEQLTDVTNFTERQTLLEGVGRLLDEREALLKATQEAANTLRFSSMTRDANAKALVLIEAAIAKAEAP